VTFHRWTLGPYLRDVILVIQFPVAGKSLSIYFRDLNLPLSGLSHDLSTYIVCDIASKRDNKKSQLLENCLKPRIPSVDRHILFFSLNFLYFYFETASLLAAISLRRKFLVQTSNFLVADRAVDRGVGLFGL